MKNIIFIAVISLMLASCTKEDPPHKIIGTWEAYFYGVGGLEIEPHFNFVFTETECTWQSTIDEQQVTGNYTLVDSVLTVYWNVPESVYNCTIQDNEMTLIGVYETIKLRRI